MEQLSQYEFEAITQLARSDKRTEILLRQLEKALCVSRDYTGVGLYTKIYVDPTAPKLDENRWKIQDMPKGHAEHPNLPLGASIILWIDGGSSRPSAAGLATSCSPFRRALCFRRRHWNLTMI